MGFRTVRGGWGWLAAWGLITTVAWAQSGPLEEERERKVAQRFLEILEKHPKRGTALDRVYGYHVERGTLDDFLKTYQARVANAPNDGAAWMVLGLLESQRGRDAAAVAAFQKAEALRPDDPLPSYYLGQSLVLVGQPDAAVPAFERALERQPARAELLEIFQALGRVHQRAQRFDEALKVWDRLEKLLPDDLRVQEQIAAALAEEGQNQEALKRVEALGQKVKDAYRKVQTKLDATDLKVRLGRVSEALGDLEALLGQLNPESWMYRDVRRRIEEVFLRTDDQAGLAKYYEEWIKKNTEDVDAMTRLGRTLALQGRAAEARVWFDKAVKLAPSRRELRVALIDQLYREGKSAEAAAQYEALAKIDGNNPDTLRDWGRLLLRDSSKSEEERKGPQRASGSGWSRPSPTMPRPPRKWPNSSARRI
jgi:tetratricopeptide (TPR) repeat protein